MIQPLFPHKRYVRFVHYYAPRYGGLRTDHRHFSVWQKLKETDLDQAYPLLSVPYSEDQGRLARDPVCMLRSCLAMMECGVTSFTIWVQMMRDEPFYAISRPPLEAYPEARKPRRPYTPEMRRNWRYSPWNASTDSWPINTGGEG